MRSETGGGGSSEASVVCGSVLGETTDGVMSGVALHPDLQLVRAAVTGDRGSARSLIQRLEPTVQARIAWVLRNTRSGQVHRRQDLEDLVQEVFVGLFARGGRDLQRWVPERGLTLDGFVALLAQRRVISILRSRRRNPFQVVLALMREQEPEEAPAVDQGLAAREQLEKTLQRLGERLSPLGWQMFQRIFVSGQDVDIICRDTGLSIQAVYQWRSRLRGLLRRILEDEDGYESSDGERRDHDA